MDDKVYISFLFRGGLAEYRRGKITVYNVNPKDSSGDEFFCMTEYGDGSLILCTGKNEIYQFNNGKFKKLYSLPHQSPAFMRFVITDENRNIWLGTERGLYILSYPYRSHKLLYPNNYFLSLLKGDKGKIWLSRLSQKGTVISNCDGYKNGNLLNEKNLYISPGSKPSQFAGKVSTGFWVAEGDNMLTNVNAKGEVAHYTVREKFNTEIKILFTDREKNLWISNEPGILKFSNFEAHSFLFNELTFGGGALALESDSLLWATNSISLYCISNNKIETANLKAHNDYIGLLHLDKEKNLWIGYWDTGVSVTRWKGNKPLSQSYYSEYDHIKIKAQNFAEDSKGNLWICGANGIFRAKNGQILEHFQFKDASGFPAFPICMAIDEENKTVWVGDNESGLTELSYEEQSPKKFLYKIKRYVTAKDGLSDEYVRSIFLDHQKNVWIGTRFGGIYKIKTRGNTIKISNYNERAELACTRILRIVPQDTTAIWFATCNGVYQYRFQNDQWHHYNTSDGLLNAEVYFCQPDSKRNLIWCLTSEGVTSLPFEIEENVPSPLINITTINVLGKPDTTALYSNKMISYSYRQNSVGFVFTSPSFIDEKKIRYKYKLEGYDKEWSEPVLNNSISYASLPPGKYIFKVVAQNAKSQWSEQPALFQFEIIMPFYRHTWFPFLCITIFLFIIYLVRFQRLKQRYRIEKLRLAIARDLHDDIGSTLGSINILSQTSVRRLQKPVVSTELTPLFEKISQSAENTLEAMDDIVWSINPDKDKFEDLIIRMREFSIPLLEAKNTQFVFEMEGNKEQPLSMDLKRNVFLVFKEAIYNIVKHSEATEAKISVTITHQFVMKIKDNGKGFIPTPTQRNGIKNMHSRTKEVNGTMKINTSVAGTEIIFTAPIR
jgi:signal transduction histidine kinase/ligand-binding sensor domain-containing protein